MATTTIKPSNSLKLPEIDTDEQIEAEHQAVDQAIKEHPVE
jgi:hypothetical protein